MEDIKANIYYLYHSGFAVKTSKHFLIFDYYLDAAIPGKKGLDGGVISMEEIAAYENVCVFVSHSHKDHYNPVILEWRKVNPGIRYIVSSDVAAAGGDVHIMAPHQSLDLGDMQVNTYGSTDMGVSFLVSTDGLTIFHAGDLNWWHWKDESTQEQVRQSEYEFMQEIEPLIGKNIDIAFFPVDPRLGTDYSAGAERLIALTKLGMFVPMHFGDNFKAARQFASRALTCTTNVVAISQRGQNILFRKRG